MIDSDKKGELQFATTITGERRYPSIYMMTKNGG